jgi:hypothetical protein
MGSPLKHCSVIDCKNDSSTKAGGVRGICRAHYKKLRKYGDPCHVHVHFSEVASWIKSHTDFDGDECLTWPFARSKQGYGVTHVEGATRLAHRVMCEAVHGAPPSTKSQAAHSCGKGHEGCVNPEHLRWDTRAGNFADKVEHGTDSRGEKSSLAKITNDDVVRIRSLRGKISQIALGAEYGITQPTVSKIQSGKRWSWMPQPF